jgi:hypothetical protein
LPLPPSILPLLSLSFFYRMTLFLTQPTWSFTHFFFNFYMSIPGRTTQRRYTVGLLLGNIYTKITRFQKLFKVANILVFCICGFHIHKFDNHD